MYEKYVDVPRNNYLEPNKFPLEFEEFYKSIDWTPYQPGEDIIIRDPHLMLSEFNGSSSFMNSLNKRHGEKIKHPGVIGTNLEELDYWAKVGRLPKQPEDICKIVDIKPYYMILINGIKYFQFAHLWLKRPGIITQKSYNSKCFLCGSQAEILFNVCRCPRRGCLNHR